MKRSMVILPAADRDLDEVALFIAEDNIGAARRFLKSADQTFRKLAEMPGMGRVWEGLDARVIDIRIWPIQDFENWLVFYRPVEEGIEVLRVLHGARDVETILDDQDG